MVWGLSWDGGTSGRVVRWVGKGGRNYVTIIMEINGPKQRINYFVYAILSFKKNKTKCSYN